MTNKRILVEHQRDFTGGLNLQADPYSIGPNETFDLLNVDLDRNGGFGVRRGVKPWITTITGFTSSGQADTLYTYVDPTGVRHLLACKDSRVRRWDGAAWQDVRAVIASSGRSQFAEMNGVLYFTNRSASGGVQSWSGTGTSTSLTAPAFHDDLAAPTGGTFPACSSLAVFNGSMWSALGNRVRWSHPGKPEDWRTNDWVDPNPGDGAGSVEALIPFRDELLVFKRRAVYSITGYPPSGITVREITRRVGTAGNWAVAAAEDAVYFWDVRTGLWRYDGEKLEWVFERIYKFMDSHDIKTQFYASVHLAWHGRRVWCMVPWQGEPYGDTFMTLVYGPDLGDKGAWTLHDTIANCLHVHDPSTGGDSVLVGAWGELVYQYDTENVHYDEITPGTQKAIKAHYTTRWFNGGNVALKKRWKRPRIVLQDEQNATMLVDVFTDYDPTMVTKTFPLQTSVDSGELVWDVGDWDEQPWAGEAGPRSAVLRGSQLGNGVAKALRFSNPTSAETIGQDWRVHGVTVTWINKRLRA